MEELNKKAMEEQNSWVFFQNIDWSCPKFNVFNVDTRDFHCGYYFRKNHHGDWHTIQKYPHFFLTQEELISLLERYFTESGGIGEWRYFALKNYDKGWNLKYLRIYRTELGFVVCDSEHRALKKEILKGEVSPKHLNHH
jgi:hypothetical protein